MGCGPSCSLGMTTCYSLSGLRQSSVREMVSSVTQSTILRHPSSESFYPTTLSQFKGFSAAIVVSHKANTYSEWPIQYLRGPDSTHWIVLLRKLSILLLRSVANPPRYVPRHSTCALPSL